MVAIDLFQICIRFNSFDALKVNTKRFNFEFIMIFFVFIFCKKCANKQKSPTTNKPHISMKC